MNTQSPSAITEKLQDTFLYYDSVKGTKYNKVSGAIAIVSAGAIGGMLCEVEHPVVGLLIGSSLSAGLLWYINKDKSQKPIDPTKISLIKENLTLKLQKSSQETKELSRQITQYRNELKDLENPTQAEKAANVEVAQGILVEKTKQYEVKFDSAIEKVKAYLTVVGLVGFANNPYTDSIIDGAQLCVALDTFATHKDNSFSKVEQLLMTIPEKFRKQHVGIIKGMLTTIGEKPKFKKITGPIEANYIATQESLRYCKQRCSSVNSEIEAIKKVYTVQIQDEKPILPAIDVFKRQMPD